jgi:hypothetical protein
LFSPLIDADGGIMDQLATHSTGHLGFEKAHSTSFNRPLRHYHLIFLYGVCFILVHLNAAGMNKNNMVKNK